MIVAASRWMVMSPILLGTSSPTDLRSVGSRQLPPRCLRAPSSAIRLRICGSQPGQRRAALVIRYGTPAAHSFARLPPGSAPSSQQAEGS
jgi:hypothetical protein